MIDAYNGSMKFYVADPTDPIIRAYEKIFPGMFMPFSSMPQVLLAHVRYPQDLFNVQSQMFTTYHVTQPDVLYSKNNQWAIPTGTSLSAPTGQMEPYYVIMRLPGQTRDEFVQILPFVPNGRPNMIGWLAAQSDAPNYGRAVSFAFPSNATVYGPTQVEAAVNQDPTVSQQLTLWGQQGSHVIIGNLLVIPIADSLLYVEPLYLQSSITPVPQLKRVIVFYRASTSAGVIADRRPADRGHAAHAGRRAHARSSAPRPPRPSSGTPGATTPPTTPTGPVSARVKTLIAQANRRVPGGPGGAQGRRLLGLRRPGQGTLGDAQGAAGRQVALPRPPPRAPLRSPARPPHPLGALRALAPAAAAGRRPYSAGRRVRRCLPDHRPEARARTVTSDETSCTYWTEAHSGTATFASLPLPSDEELLEGSASCPEQFVAFYDRHAAGLLAFFGAADLRLAGGGRPDRRDLRAGLRGAPRFRNPGPGAATAWLYTIARRQLNRFVGGNASSRSGGSASAWSSSWSRPTRSSGPRSSSISRRCVTQVAGGLNALNGDLREAVVLRVVDGLSYPEAARLAGCQRGPHAPAREPRPQTSGARPCHPARRFRRGVMTGGFDDYLDDLRGQLSRCADEAAPGAPGRFAAAGPARRAGAWGSGRRRAGR